MCAMIETYDYPDFFYVIFFSIQLSITRTLIFYLNFVFYFILKIYGSLLRIDQLYAICW